MKLVKKLLAIGGVVTAISSAHADYTISQPVLRTQFNETANIAYVVGAAKWGGACPATYVTINPAPGNANGVSQMLSIILAAQFAGKNVTFIGACDTNPDYFVAFYVIVG